MRLPDGFRRSILSLVTQFLETRRMDPSRLIPKSVELTGSAIFHQSVPLMHTRMFLNTDGGADDDIAANANAKTKLIDGICAIVIGIAVLLFVKCRHLDEVQSEIDSGRANGERESFPTDGIEISDFDSRHTAVGDRMTVYADTLMYDTLSIKRE
jgi:hypothetical protein